MTITKSFISAASYAMVIIDFSDGTGRKLQRPPDGYSLETKHCLERECNRQFPSADFLALCRKNKASSSSQKWIAAFLQSHRTHLGPIRSQSVFRIVKEESNASLWSHLWIRRPRAQSTTWRLLLLALWTSLVTVLLPSKSVSHVAALSVVMVLCQWYSPFQKNCAKTYYNVIMIL